MMKKVSFFYGMVTATMHDSRTYKREEAASALGQQLKGGRLVENTTIENYATVATYTVAMEFNWSAGVPDEYKALETWWQLRQRGATEAECWHFFAENVGTAILQYGISEARAKKDGVPPFRDWTDALLEALKIWHPPEWKLNEELTAAERADPN